MGSFLEFLLTEGTIRHEALLDAVASQVRGQPTPAEIAVKRSILTHAEACQVIILQSTEGSSFLSAFKKLPFWSETKASEIQKNIANEAPSITSLLIQQGTVTLEALQKSHARFSEQKALSPIAAPVEKVEPVITPVATPNLTLIEGGGMPSQMGHDISREVLPITFFERLKEVAAQYAKQDLAEAEFLKTAKDLFHGFYQLQGTSNFLGAPHFQRLAEIFSRYFEKIMQTSSVPDHAMRARLQAIVNLALRLIERSISKENPIAVKEAELEALCDSLENQLNNQGQLNPRKAAS